MNLKELVRNHWTKLASVVLGYMVALILGFFNHVHSDGEGFFVLFMVIPGMAYFYWVLLELHFKRLTLSTFFSELKADIIPSIIIFSLLVACTGSGYWVTFVVYLCVLASSVLYVKAARKSFACAKDWLQRPKTVSVSLIAAREDKVATNAPHGVKGWLKFFCISLTIISPLLTIGTLSKTWENAKPVFVKLPSLENYYTVGTIGSAILLLYGFMVGYAVWSGDPDGKKLAKKYLLIRLAGVILTEAVSILFVLDLPRRALNILLVGSAEFVFREILFFIIWWFYFKKSKRVANTYR